MKMPAMSRRTALAATAMVVGVAVIALALLGGSGSSGGDNPASSADTKIDPVEPINPKDNDARNPEDEEPINYADPFAASFGASTLREVTVHVTANGYVNVGVYYRDRHKPRKMAVRSHSATRTFKGRFPMAAIVLQIPGNLPGGASRATCTLMIDGVEVDSKSTSKPGALKACVG